MKVGSNSMDNLLKRLGQRQRKGSKPRCHWLTHGSPEQVASRLNALAAPWGSVSANDHWMPEGFGRTAEAQLHDATMLLPLHDCEVLGEWWLAEASDDSKTPNWDIASICTIGGSRGLLLVEAKAHSQELKVNEQVTGSRSNRERIAKCIDEANSGLGVWTELDWTLSHEHRYQMANRFAWSWKLTELGYPIILVYLGFLMAEEMRSGRKQTSFDTHAEWEAHVKSHSQPLFWEGVWCREWMIHGQTFVPRIRSIKVHYDRPMENEQ